MTAKLFIYSRSVTHIGVHFMGVLQRMVRSLNVAGFDVIYSYSFVL